MKPRRPGYLYVLGNDRGHTKIGITEKDVLSRVSQLRTGDPSIFVRFSSPLREDYKSLEKALHKAYSKYNVGLEWFNLSEAHISDIRKVLCPKSNTTVERWRYAFSKGKGGSRSKAFSS